MALMVNDVVDKYLVRLNIHVNLRTEIHHLVKYMTRVEI